MTLKGAKVTPRARYSLPKNPNRLWVKKKPDLNFTLRCQNSTNSNHESNSYFQKMTPRVLRVPGGR